MKKKKTLHIMVMVLLLLLTAGCIGGYMYDRKENSEKAGEAAGMVLEEGEKSAYAEIISIAGNEISYIEISQEEMEETEETEETAIIPVGTAVITKLGTTTTFSRLASGDIIQIKQDIETEEILEIWIVG